MSIKSLPENVVALVKSSAVITSLNQVVDGLLKNALDAGASKVNISVDHGRGDCSVEDDGAGIIPSEFLEDGGLGRLYCTSKYPPEPTHHGRYGSFIAAVSALSLFSITSHHEEYNSQHSLAIHNAKVIARNTPALPEHRLVAFPHGTRVIVRDLFGSMPVRVKQRALEAMRSGTTRDFDQLVHQTVALLLAWPSALSITIRDSSNRQTLSLRTKAGHLGSESTVVRTSSLLTQAALLNEVDPGDWVAVSATAIGVSIHGCISLTPTATKRVQFISLGISPLPNNSGSNILYGEVNKVFANSAFGILGEESESDDVQPVNQVRQGSAHGQLKERKGIDKWPMFNLRVELAEADKNTLLLGDDLDRRHPQVVAFILDLLRMMAYQFLEKHHFRPKPVNAASVLSQPAAEPVGALLRDSDQPSRSQITSESQGLRSSTPSRSISKSSSRRTGRLQSTSGQHLSGVSERRAESPFAAWSRVKASRPMNSHVKHATNGQTVELANDVPFRTERGGETERASNPPFCDKSGKLLRKPFAEPSPDAPVPRAGPVDASEEKTQAKTPTTETQVPDDEFVWVNPATQIRTTVDARTGFVIRPREEHHRRLTMRPSLSTSNSTGQPTQSSTTERTSSPWVKDLLTSWKNPVFETTQASIPRLSDVAGLDQNEALTSGHRCNPGDRVVIGNFGEGSSIQSSGSVSKAALRSAEVIAQVDRKFVLAKVPTASQISGEGPGTLLVLVDQHAADERVRVEQLMADYFAPVEGDRSNSAALSERLAKPLRFEFPTQEGDLFVRLQSHFESWGIGYKLLPIEEAIPGGKSRAIVEVQALPPCILERCRAEPRVLSELLRKEIWKLHDRTAVKNTESSIASLAEAGGWPSRFYGCPEGILDLINSRACRSAIMFNDELSKEKCTELLKRLANCAFPFQCAHGRPSMTPLLDLGDRLGSGLVGSAAPQAEPSLLSRLRAWKEAQKGPRE